MSVANSRHPLIALPLWRRIAVCAALGFGMLSWAALILWVITLTGDRYQRLGRAADTETDMWVLSLAYPVGCATAGAMTGALVPWVRRQWQAALLGGVSAVPFFALLSVTQDPRGPHPYRVDWLLSLGLGMALGGLIGAGVFSGLRKAVARRRRAAQPGAPDV